MPKLWTPKVHSKALFSAHIYLHDNLIQSFKTTYVCVFRLDLFLSLRLIYVPAWSVSPQWMSKKHFQPNESKWELQISQPMSDLPTFFYHLGKLQHHSSNFLGENPSITSSMSLLLASSFQPIRKSSSTIKIYPNCIHSLLTHWLLPPSVWTVPATLKEFSVCWVLNDLRPHRRGNIIL